MTEKLGDHLTIRQIQYAMGLSSKSYAPYYRIARKGNIKSLHIGHTVLVPAAAFCEAAGLPPFAGAWPERLAELPVAQLMSRKQAAEELGVSVSHLYNLIAWKKIRVARLWPWGGYTLFIKEIDNE